ncbi:MAG: thiamine pyrophosphate-dependent enzyme, partial [Pseudohongiellaceae bacterium]
EFQDFGLRFGNPDFVQYAQSYGAKGHRLESSDGLCRLIDEAFAAGGVHLIDTPLDYKDSHYILMEEVAQLSAKV